MRILSNAFPTNLPDSETISQGGPANFERLFLEYIEDTGSQHEWVGVMLEGIRSEAAHLRKVHAEPHRVYYRLEVPKSMFGSVLKARDLTPGPERILGKPIKKIEQLIRKQRPDVVFLNGYGLLNWMLLRAARNSDIPVVIQHAGIWTKELRIHKDKYSESGRLMMERMERESSELSSAEIFLNSWSRDYYRAHVAVGSSPATKIVPLPFNFSAFKKLSKSPAGTSMQIFDPSKKHIGVIARWDTIKNHAAVLAMAKEAQRRKLSWQFHSIVEIPTGDHYQKEKKEYEKYIDVLPPVGRVGIADFCRSMDLLILPSIFDVSPTVVLEAVSLGTPIVISPTVGHVRTFLANNGGAWVIDPNDAGIAVRRIDAILGKGLPAELRKRILNLHDHREVFGTYLKVFREVQVRRAPLWQVAGTFFQRQAAHFLKQTRRAPKELIAPHGALRPQFFNPTPSGMREAAP